MTIAKRTYPKIPGSIISDTSGSNKGMVVYHSTSDDTLFSLDNPVTQSVGEGLVGNEVLWYFSGAAGSKSTGANFGTALFLGDVVISGSLYSESGSQSRHFGLYKGTFNATTDWIVTGSDLYTGVTHSLGSSDVIVQIYDTAQTSKFMILPDEIEILDTNRVNVVIASGSQFAGQINVMAM